MTDGGGMEDGEASAILIPLHEARRERLDMPVAFERRELDLILRLYGRMVAANEWRDYAIDHLTDRAVFSVFRRTSEVPLFQIVKDPKLARRQGGVFRCRRRRAHPQARTRAGAGAGRFRQQAEAGRGLSFWCVLRGSLRSHVRMREVCARHPLENQRLTD